MTTGLHLMPPYQVEFRSGLVVSRAKTVAAIIEMSQVSSLSLARPLAVTQTCQVVDLHHIMDEDDGTGSAGDVCRAV
jgi:hypothetical protein